MRLVSILLLTTALEQHTGCIPVPKQPLDLAEHETDLPRKYQYPAIWKSSVGMRCSIGLFDGTFFVY